MANNFAFIDSQNVHLAIRDQGWDLDWARFRRYLKDKYDVTTAFAFIGYVPGNERIYTSMREAGYRLIFKPSSIIWDGSRKVTKGNVDAELVLHAMIELNNYDGAVIVSGDGDFHCLIDYLKQQKKLRRLIVPNFHKYSRLLKEFAADTTYLNRLLHKICQHKKRGISSGQNPSDGLSS